VRTEYVLALNGAGFHRICYREWGSADNDRVLLCVHGLTRNSRDFDELAKSLSRDYRVICPDLVGRGGSDWLPAGQPYHLPQYLNDMATLIARLNVETIDWVGTSLGGIIGYCLAAMDHSPIRHLVLNDIGPLIPQSALARIASQITEPVFNNRDEVEACMRERYPAWRYLSDEQWYQLSLHATRTDEQERLHWHFDPAIGSAATEASTADIDLWPVWQKVSIPQLLIWGQDSDVLTETTVRQMQQNEQLELLELPGIDHVPSLMEPEHITTIVDWLRRHRNH